jgi:hypothetical protein
MEEKIINRLFKYIDYKDVRHTRFEKEIGLSNGYLNTQLKRHADLGEGIIKKIIDYCLDLNSTWLLTGKGDMLNADEDTSPNTDNMDDDSDKDRKKIPLFDVVTIGGVNERVADMEGNSTPPEWIDAGDWFMNATAAIYHYGDSMAEYPSGCILAIREVYELELIVWGKNYVIETDEYRITKRLQRGDSDDCVIAYSTNDETYPDGKLIHEPISIPKESIRRLSLVLGHVVREQSSGILYNVRKRR